jgi:2-dehydro-3-deoxyphosphogluconate aldolase / (4S)-4-hydroxy-2-oxoglutarate aldolase
LEVTMARVEDRRAMLAELASYTKLNESIATIRGMDAYQQRALALLTAPETQRAFEIHQEDPKLRDRYGRTTYGQGCLLARRLAEAGVKFVEITFTVPQALDVISTLATRSDLCVGAGTVLSIEQAEAAIGAGAEFVVSPSLELSLVPVCHAANIACFLGAATPTEVLSAARAQADLVKIFPADLLGGVEFVKQMSGPFPEIQFMVSGGVNLANLKGYVQAGVVGICLGSSLLARLLANRSASKGVRDRVRRIRTG